jgi:zinc D-Ala-D-Ala carboxypeptidase
MSTGDRDCFHHLTLRPNVQQSSCFSVQSLKRRSRSGSLALMSNSGVPGKPSSLSASSFDEIPEAIRETVEVAVPRRRLPLPVVAGLAIVLSMGAIGAFQLGRSRPAAPIANLTVSNPNASPTPAADGTLLGHYPYKEVNPDELAPITVDGQMQLHQAAAQAFKEMSAAAQADGVTLVPLSAYRSLQDQKELFFEVKKERVQTASERAGVSAPPGYSEHHTGYALDLGDGNVPAVNLSAEFETTAAFKWLQENAPRFSFEISFPQDNPQGVTYEPWHWRYVGDSTSLETFYKARNVKPAL